MKIIQVTCNIQEGSIGYDKIKQLEAIISSTYKTHFGAEYRLVFFWLNLPYQQSYIAGKLSTASSVQIPVQDGLANSKRHPFMSEICAKWMHITGCSKDEIILVSSDKTQAKAFMDSMSSRFKPSVRKRTQFKILFRLCLGRLKKGYFTTSVNL